jgi:hypothetical protein
MMANMSRHDAALESVVAEGGIFGAVATMESILEALGEEMPEHLKEK